jgi:hypothetical protein
VAVECYRFDVQGLYPHDAAMHYGLCTRISSTATEFIQGATTELYQRPYHVEVSTPGDVIGRNRILSAIADLDLQTNVPRLSLVLQHERPTRESKHVVDTTLPQAKRASSLKLSFVFLSFLSRIDTGGSPQATHGDMRQCLMTVFALRARQTALRIMDCIVS